MTRERMREIAWSYWLWKVQQEGKTDMPSLRQIQQIALDLNTPYDFKEYAFYVVEQTARCLLDQRPLTQLEWGLQVSYGEIALRYMIHRMSHGKTGIKINQGMRREIGNVAQAIGEPFEDCLEFVRTILQDLITENLSN